MYINIYIYVYWTVLLNFTSFQIRSRHRCRWVRQLKQHGDTCHRLEPGLCGRLSTWRPRHWDTFAASSNMSEKSRPLNGHFRWTNHRKRSRRYFFQQAMLDCQRIFALHCWSSGNCSWFLRCFSCIWMCFYVSFLRHFWSDSRRLYHWEFVGKMVAAVALIVFWKW